MARCAFTRLVHSDWSTSPKKRWAAEAQRTSSGWWVDAPKQVGVLDDFLDDLLGLPQPTLAGFDFPIGVPAAYARKAKVSSFTDLLEALGDGDWSEFYCVCKESKEISLHRPFYPSGFVFQGATRPFAHRAWCWRYRRRKKKLRTSDRHAKSRLFPILDARWKPGRQGGDFRLARRRSACKEGGRATLAV